MTRADWRSARNHPRTDRALAGGLLGLDPDDERLRRSLDLAEDAGVALEFRTVKLRGDVHPNSVRVTARRGDVEVQVTWPDGTLGRYPAQVDAWVDLQR